LPRSRLFVPPINFRHQKDFVAITVTERLPHPYLTHAIVVIPAVVHKVDAIINGGPDDPDALFFVLLLADVVAPQPDKRYFLTRASERAVGHLLLCHCSKQAFRDTRDDRQCSRRCKQFPAGHDKLFFHSCSF